MNNNSPVKPNKKKGVIPVFANVGAVDKYVGLGNYIVRSKTSLNISLKEITIVFVISQIATQLL